MTSCHSVTGPCFYPCYVFYKILNCLSFLFLTEKNEYANVNTKEMSNSVRNYELQGNMNVT
jgi:hypothetical protein